MFGIQRNKHLWGWKASIQFAFISLGDALIRVFSVGMLSTNWVIQFVQKQGAKAIQGRKAQK